LEGGKRGLAEPLSCNIAHKTVIFKSAEFRL